MKLYKGMECMRQRITCMDTLCKCEAKEGDHTLGYCKNAVEGFECPDNKIAFVQELNQNQAKYEWWLDGKKSPTATAHQIEYNQYDDEYDEYDEYESAQYQVPQYEYSGIYSSYNNDFDVEYLIDILGILLIGLVVTTCCCIGSIMAIFAYKLYNKYNKPNQDLNHYDTEMSQNE